VVTDRSEALARSSRGRPKLAQIRPIPVSPRPSAGAAPPRLLQIEQPSRACLGADAPAQIIRGSAVGGLLRPLPGDVKPLG
jgi:hypothetical protein